MKYKAQHLISPEPFIEPICTVAENLWQTLCYVKQALYSGQEIDKEYIAKVLAENRPEENFNPSTPTNDTENSDDANA